MPALPSVRPLSNKTTARIQAVPRGRGAETSSAYPLRTEDSLLKGFSADSSQCAHSRGWHSWPFLAHGWYGQWGDHVHVGNPGLTKWQHVDPFNFYIKTKILVSPRWFSLCTFSPLYSSWLLWGLTELECDHHFKAHVGMASAHAGSCRMLPEASAVTKPGDMQLDSAFCSQANQANFTL